MFLHIGRDVIVPLREIVAIINLVDDYSQLNSEFLKTAEEEGFVIQLSKKPISCIISAKNIYLSPISVQTLNKRAGLGYLREIEFKES